MSKRCFLFKMFKLLKAVWKEMKVIVKFRLIKSKLRVASCWDCYSLDKDFKMSSLGLENLDETGESCTTPGGAEKDLGRRSSCDILRVKRGYQDEETTTETVEMITSFCDHSSFGNTESFCFYVFNIEHVTNVINLLYLMYVIMDDIRIECDRLICDCLYPVGISKMKIYCG